MSAHTPSEKKQLSERDICSQYIHPALTAAGWDRHQQIREEVTFTDGRIHVNGQRTTRGPRKRADYILFYKPNIPVAVIEAKDNTHALGAGLQQGLQYAEVLDIPLVFSTNGDGFLMHDRSGYATPIERTLALDEFPTPANLWAIYCHYKGIVTNKEERIARFDYFFESEEYTPRYYQQIAINRTVEAIAKGQQRGLLVMATGTGKTYTAFQIIYRLWKSGFKKRILFLADRTALITQTKRDDFKHFGDDVMTIIRHKKIDKAFQIYLAIYQGLTSYDTQTDAFREFSPTFFDLIIVDECHRGSAKADSAWREILEYFSAATQIGLTATPKETQEASNSDYFGEPLYTYSLKQGIEDGFLAPYKVIRVGVNVDLEGWRPEEHQRDLAGELVEDRIYNTKDYDKTLVIDERTRLVAQKVIEYLRKIDDVYAKTIIFCVDIEHAERMRSAIVNAAPDEVRENSKYVVRITGDDEFGKRELDNFTDPEVRYPVIATTSKLMTTGVNAQTCKLIVLDAPIGSMTEFKQIIGRGTRIKEAYGKHYFTIMDFRNVTDLFADEAFDGEPVLIRQVGADEVLSDEDIWGEDVVDESIDDGATLGDEGQTGTEADHATEGAQFTQKRVSEQYKVYVAGIEVAVLNERHQYLDADGKLITTSLRDYTRKQLHEKFRSLDNFLTHWHEADQKSVLIAELAEQGIILEALQEEVQKEFDLFDLICHVAWDRPALSRRERAGAVKKSSYFDQYGAGARAVLEALLDKYAQGGVAEIETLDVLRMEPFPQMGTLPEIIKLFGDKKRFEFALNEMKDELYGLAA